MTIVTSSSNILSAFSLARHEVLAIPTYNAGMSIDAVRKKYPEGRLARIASNENPLGASAAMGVALARCNISHYPDPNCQKLRARLSSYCDVPADQIVIGNGSEDIIKMICEAFVGAGDVVLTVTPGFGLHESYALLMGARVQKVPVTGELTFDVPAMKVALENGCHVLMFSNPSNPVGCHMSGEELQDVIHSAPLNTLIVLDEAYFEYAQGKGFADSLPILKAQGRPWIVLRTFSKAYGLAGLRVGYGLTSSPDIVSLLDRVRTPFNVNTYAQEAAMTALNDPIHVTKTISLADEQRQFLSMALRALNFSHAPTVGNFLFVDVRRPATVIADYLLSKGVVVKPWKEIGYENFIRVSLGSALDSEAFISALASFSELDGK